MTEAAGDTVRCETQVAILAATILKAPVHVGACTPSMGSARIDQQRIKS